jgi:hypothetical protein
LIDSDNAITAWCFGELAPWIKRPVSQIDLEIDVELLNSTHGWVFVIDIDRNMADIRPKPLFYTATEMADESIPAIGRLLHYIEFIKNVVARYPLDGKCSIAIDVSDGAVADWEMPLFAFQKSSGSKKILIPDPDFFYNSFYCSDAFHDTVSFDTKKNKAAFVGSTTGGGIITEDAVKILSVPRLRAGVRFMSYPHIEFKLPVIVHCDSVQTEQAIRALGFGVNPSSWQDQFYYKSLISMDGNGPTCSRVVLALRSNSVLLKYESPCILYYFAGLQPWIHYVPITCDDDVINMVEKQLDNPDLFRYIAQEGAEFYQDFLQKDKVYLYMATLLKMYYKLALR